MRREGETKREDLHILFMSICSFLVRCSYLEIYNEEVRDLLDKNHKTRKEAMTSK